MRCEKTFLTLLFLLFFAHVSAPTLCSADIAVIKINFREASEMLPMVEMMLSKEGRATVDARTNSIVIKDRSESLERIRKFLDQIDKPAEQVTVRFKFRQENVSESRDISASGRVSGDNWSVSVGKDRREGVHVRAQDERRGVTQRSESFIRVLSGDAAYIRVGKEIPYTERWVYLSRRYAHFVKTLDLQTVETGMEVRPVVSGDRVHIEIIPRVSYMEPGKKGIILFSEASTRLSVSKGQWITIGGHGERSNEVIREVLARRSAEDRSTYSMSLMVEP